ncbi:beta-ketoacyl-[acyl-carrier-protein] synthase family protein [Streptomyces sp. B1866]|uniref:beta-ketoacyl-[acyl-carrier-protein] synthase family protein n=1 Tax=Streptomyces sp. B1866 TaxID=3075431 RepID=UPI0028910890|nr:beta-ketoacyl-[acyl-carrier-protein] synthase family protein [Streptomyces sp. B1866]MDT3395878.1 beta-ketoacyl-[acyl-carrier-protein] synthase family protein [Streptomyces sp. B1866]
MSDAPPRGRRVVITGIGLLTALGEGRRDTWTRLLAGDSAVGPVRGYDPASFRTRLAAEIEDFDATRYAPRRALRTTTRNDRLAIAGAALAVRDAELDFGAYDPERAAAFVGGNKEISNPEHLLRGSLAARRPDGRADYGLLGERASAAFYPLYYVEGLQSAALYHLSAAYGLKGPNAYFHGTADASATAVGRAYRAIRRGEAEVALAGGCDDAASWWVTSKMDGLGVLSTRNDLGAEAFRPYDADRSGSVLGDGAAFLVLEEYQAALRRGAHVYAEIRGFGSTLDSDRLLTPAPSGAPLAAAVGHALQEAGTDPGGVDYVATHGCATRAGDASEARALRTVFEGAARPPVASSVKPATGHLVAAAGALNAAVCALAIDGGAVPPTLNLQRPDPACAGLDWVPGQAREMPVRGAVALARGLEGQQVALALTAA